MPLTIVCATCGDTGWKYLDGGQVTRCECWLASRQPHASGVPLEFQAATLENYRAMDGNSAAITAAREFAEDGRDLYLAGGVGAGKTRLACSLLNDLHKRGQRGCFARVPMLLLKLQPQHAADGEAEAAQLLQTLFTVPVLVLDDIGAERDGASDFTRRTLLTVYEERGDRGLRTVWTSNLRLAPDPAQRQNPHRAKTLGEFMGDDRLASRIAGRARIVVLLTPDQRIRRRRGEE